MISFFLKGGPVMWVLLGCSIWGLYISIYKYLFLKFHSFTPQLTIEKVKTNLLEMGADDTIKDLMSQKKIIYTTLAKAIRKAVNSAHSKEPAENGINDITYVEIPKLEKHMAILSSIITVAPILGLLGTVMGLMTIFNVISGGQLGNAQALSGGIGEALITTVTGLVIAIPFIFSYQYLSQKIDNFIMEMEHSIVSIIQFYKANAK